MITVMVSSGNRDNLVDFREWLLDNDYFPTDLERKAYRGSIQRYALAVSVSSDVAAFGRMANEIKRRLADGKM